MSRLSRRGVLGAVLLVAVFGAVAGGGTWAAFQDSGPAEATASVVDHFQVTATIESVSPSELNTNTSSDGPVTVEVSLPAGDDVDLSTVTAEFENGNAGTVTPDQSTCDPSGCTFNFTASAIESLADSNGTYTLRISGEYSDGGTFESAGGQNQVELCDGTCDGSTGDLAPVPIPVGSTVLSGLAVTEVWPRG